MTLNETQSRVLQILKESNLDFRQRKNSLAYTAENTLPYPLLSEKASEARSKRIICDLYEGSAPYRPRYILPDYELALQKGCEFLELPPPLDLDEALNFLTILYAHVPSITGYPVFLGELDNLLLRFCDGISPSDLHKKLRLFLRSIDRMLPDAFVHANIGPTDNLVARTLLNVEREGKNVVPNLSLKFAEGITTDELLLEGIKTVFEVGKPYFVNDKMMRADLGGKYGVASCYNSLKIGGGAHTLVRLCLNKIIDGTVTPQKFLEELLPLHVNLTCEIIKARINFMVEESRFFDHHFLAKEKFIDIKNFSAMFGVVGLAETVNSLLGNQPSMRYGHYTKANELGYKILATIADQIKEFPLPYCEGNEGRAFLHAQSGIDTDVGSSPGARIPVGDEPPLLEHIMAVAPTHSFFNAGTSDIFIFDKTARQNPEAVLNIIKGAFAQGMRLFTMNISDNELVRITGYLVRQSDLDKFKEQGSRLSSTVFGYNTTVNENIFARRKRISNNEHGFD